MKHSIGVWFVGTCVGMCLCAAEAEERTMNWPQFRGPTGQGHAGAPGLPLEWSEEKNISWKTAVHGRGWSSPVIWGEQVWVTTATEDGKELSVLCLDLETGQVVKDMKLFDVPDPQFAHKFNSYASPTPVIEEGAIYVTFGSPGTVRINTETFEREWERRDLECNHFRGAGSSPILFEDLLIMNFDGSDLQYVIALDKETGETVWRTDRSIDFMDLDPDGKPEAEGDFRKAFSTPHVTTVEGVPLLISVGAKAGYAYNPRTGEEYWRVEERRNHSASSRPVVGNGLIYWPSGFAQGQLLAVDPSVGGDVTESHVEWTARRGVSKKPSLMLVDGLIYMMEDGGVLNCVDAKTGEYLWQERVGGNHSASPVHAAGRIYFCNEEGKTTVVAASREFEVLAENELEEGFMASPAVSGDALVLRTKTHVYRVEEGKGKTKTES